jgi:hypothetical protein
MPNNRITATLSTADTTSANASPASPGQRPKNQPTN